MVNDVLDDMLPFFSANGGKARSTMVYLFPFLIAMLKNYSVPCKEVCFRTGSPVKKQRTTDIPPGSSSHLHQLKDVDRTGRTTPSSNNRNPSAKPRVVKHGSDLALLTPLEVRMVATKKVRESSTRLKVFGNEKS
ncbi:unnamed protein product [Prunus armeniaca]